MDSVPGPILELEGVRTSARCKIQKQTFGLIYSVSVFYTVRKHIASGANMTKYYRYDILKTNVSVVYLNLFSTSEILKIS